MRRVHRVAMVRVGANRLGRNGVHRRVHREGLDGTGDGNEAWRTAERRKRPCVRPATFETGSCSLGGVWRPQNGRNRPPTVETGVLLIGRVWRTAKRTKRTCVGALRSKRGPCSSREVWHTTKRDPPASMGYCSSTVDLLQPPWAPVHPASTAHYSTGYCSTTPPWAPVQPPLHGHPYTVYYSSSPPRGRPVHPALHEILFIQPQPARSIGILFIQRQHHGVRFIHTHRELFIQTPL